MPRSKSSSLISNWDFTFLSRYEMLFKNREKLLLKSYEHQQIRGVRLDATKFLLVYVKFVSSNENEDNTLLEHFECKCAKKVVTKSSYCSH